MQKPSGSNLTVFSIVGQPLGNISSQSAQSPPEWTAGVLLHFKKIYIYGQKKEKASFI